METMIFAIITIACFVAVACIWYDMGKKVGAKDKYKYGMERFDAAVSIYNEAYDEVSEELVERRKMIIKLIKDKEKAVKACRKYRERANLLEDNLNNLIDTYQSNENNLFEAVKQNAFLAGQVQAYQKALPDSTSKEK